MEVAGRSYGRKEVKGQDQRIEIVLCLSCRNNVETGKWWCCMLKGLNLVYVPPLPHDVVEPLPCSWPFSSHRRKTWPAPSLQSLLAPWLAAPCWRCLCLAPSCNISPRWRHGDCTSAPVFSSRPPNAPCYNNDFCISPKSPNTTTTKAWYLT